MKDLMKLDLYDLLNIKANAGESEIKKAYRKKALICHPDKNPNNPKAIEDFKQLSKVMEILTNKSQRAEYDRILRARKAANAKKIFDRGVKKDPANRRELRVPKWPPAFPPTQNKHEKMFWYCRRKNLFHKNDLKRSVPTWPPSASKTQSNPNNWFASNTNFDKSFSSGFYSPLIKPATFIAPTSSTFSGQTFGHSGNSFFNDSTRKRTSSILKPGFFLF